MGFQDRGLQASTTQGRKAEGSHCTSHTAPIQGDWNTAIKLKDKKKIFMLKCWTTQMKTTCLLMKLLRAVKKVCLILQRSLDTGATNLLVILLIVPPAVALARELGAVAGTREDISLQHIMLPSPSLPTCNLSLMTANQSIYCQRDCLMAVYSTTLQLQSKLPSSLLPQSLATSPLSPTNQY